MEYSRRTSRCILSHFASSGTKPMHIRVLIAVFKDAWREHELKLPGFPSASPLKLSREYRSRLWWSGIKDATAQRVREGLVHSGFGPRCEWEDVLCTFMGPSWRQTRDACGSKGAWMKHCRSFVQQVCTAWSLPGGRCEPEPENPSRASRRSFCTTTWITSLQPMVTDALILYGTAMVVVSLSWWTANHSRTS